MVDWGPGRYETTAAELAPVAEAVIAQARISPGEDVIDLACRARASRRLTEKPRRPQAFVRAVLEGS